MKQYKACVLGAGAFGTAMAHAAAANNYMTSVSVYARNSDVVDHINEKHRNPKFFSDYELSSKIRATTDLCEAIKDAQYVLSCIPVQQVRPFLQEHKDKFKVNVPFVSCSKGIVVETGQVISQVAKEVLGNDLNYAALSGPSFAEEILKKCITLIRKLGPTVIVVASENEKTAKLIQLGLSSNFFRIYSQKDVVGVELAGALKNVLAIGAGIVEGAGFGYNTTTAFLARGVREMQLFSRHFGADKHTFYGLAGIGDLMLTSNYNQLIFFKGFGKLSRNRQCGVRLGSGESLQQIIESSKGVVEGIPTLEMVRKRGDELGLDMPITYTIYDIAYGILSKDEGIKRLMNQRLMEEFPPTFEDLLE